MGRYLNGTAGFSHKYVFAEQDSNLAQLEQASGVGRAGLIPAFVTVVEGQLVSVSCMELARRVVRDTGALGEVRHVLSRDEVLASSTLERVQYAMAENIVEVLSYVDEALPAATRGLELVGQQFYELHRADREGLLAYVNAALPDGAAPLELDDLANGDRVDSAFGALWGVDGFLPHLALAIVRHAVTHDLELLRVEEQDAGMVASQFWDLTPEWAGERFQVPADDDADAHLARGLVALFAQQPSAHFFEHLHAIGDERSVRWLALVQGDVPPLPPASHRRRRAPHPEGEAILQAAITRAELTRELLDQPRGTRGGMQLYLAPGRVLDLLQSFPPAVAGDIDPPPPARPIAILFYTLLMVPERSAADVARALDVAERWYGELPDGRHRPERQVLFYNMACAASFVGRLDRALQHIATALALGNNPQDFRDDSDFAPLHGSPELEAVLAEAPQLA